MLLQPLDRILSLTFKKQEDGFKLFKQESGIRSVAGIADEEDLAEELEQRAKLDAELSETPRQNEQQKHRKLAAEKPPGKPRKMPPAPTEDSPTTAASETATASPAESSKVSSSNRQKKMQLDQNGFAEAVKAEFAKLIAAGGGVTPNEAAVQALATVKTQHGL